MGIMYLAASPAGKSGSSSSPLFFLVLIVLFGAFYFLMIRPQRNRQRRVMQTQNQVVPGHRIRTTAGMYGTVVSGDGDDIVVEIAPGVQVTMMRRAIMDVHEPTPVVDEPQDEDFETDFSHPFESEDADQPNGSAPHDEREVKDHNV